MPILYSCHPRSKKRLDAMGFKLDERVKRVEKRRAEEKAHRRNVRHGKS